MAEMYHKVIGLAICSLYSSDDDVVAGGEGSGILLVGEQTYYQFTILRTMMFIS